MDKPQEQPKKLPKLTKKRKGFVKDFVLSGNGTEAAMNNFDTKNRAVASSISKELLEKPEIQQAVVVATEEFKDMLDRIIPEEGVLNIHASQLRATRMDHMTFPLGPEGEDDINLSGAVVTKAAEDMEDMGEGELPEEWKERTTLTDKEIIDMLAEVNCTVRRIVHGNSARHVYFWSPDTTARDKALDKAYKLRGRFADETYPLKTPQNVTYNFIFSKETMAEVDIINARIKDRLINAQKNKEGVVPGN